MTFVYDQFWRAHDLVVGEAEGAERQRSALGGLEGEKGAAALPVEHAAKRALLGVRGVGAQGLAEVVGTAVVSESGESALALAGGAATNRPGLSLDGRVEPGERVATAFVALQKEDASGLERFLGVGVSLGVAAGVGQQLSALDGEELFEGGICAVTVASCRFRPDRHAAAPHAQRAILRPLASWPRRQDLAQWAATFVLGLPVDELPAGEAAMDATGAALRYELARCPKAMSGLLNSI